MIRRVVVLAIAVSVIACSKQPEAEGKAEPASRSATVDSAVSAAADPHAEFEQMGVEEVKRLLDAKRAVAVDANDEDTRKQFGVVPNALLLSNYYTFALSELPADKSTRLVFYCSNPNCLSAPRAASKAKNAGYTSVAVMRAGIAGWLQAGNPVDKS